ncbi:Adenylate cyclase 2 [Enhygromyxa salina]|uniref:Adenylate cyclase 2 n=1 Tax=Enhygromyxa salina TaxID=215803 RepID=A0A2S9XAR1_9BACT|nr:adenylate/guanylate cyclase domain-containing protein [Enhygromyxa salina]PRP89946.1 Adenylate cyclase 2 [Enhygromyxa salina]
MARVIANPGNRDERVHELESGRALIGRGRDCDIRVNNKSLSRQHARIVVESSGRATIEDIGSKNGTFVDGDRVEGPRELDDGQHFSCGDVVFVYSIAEYSVPAPDSMIQEISAEATRVLVSDLLSQAQNRRSSGLGRPKLPKSAEGRLQVLLEVARLLSSPGDLDKQLAKILDLVFSILDIDRVALIMIDEASGEFGDPIVESRREATLGDVPGTYSRNILNYVRERSVAALFSDAAVDPRLAGAQSVHLASVRSSICAPLKPHDEIIGVLYVDNLTLPAAFTSEDLELLSAFAAQAAIAIENSRLYQRLQDEAIQRSNLLRFFPPTAIAQLMEHPKLTVDAIDTEVTALFCDISGFTEMSAQMAPTDVVGVLNRYFPVITEIVFEHEGTLEKYIGDALLAVWGAPFRRVDDAKRAVLAAIQMQEAITRLNLELTNFPPLQIHIGLNTGRVAAGNIGSEHYLQYATIGDATNLASRICGLAGAEEIAVGVSTLERLGGPPPCPVDGPHFHKVKGREDPVAIYKLRWQE